MSRVIPDYSSPPRARRASLLTLFLIVFIDLMGFGIVLPNLQLYGRDFGISNYFILTLLGATYSLFQFLFAPLLGRWSDHVGRRPVLIISQAGTLVGFLILYSAHFFESSEAGMGIALIFVSRVIDGVSGGNISTASAYVADITPPEQRAKGMGMIGAAFGIGFVFGPLIGGLVAYYVGLSFVPLVAAGFSATALVLTVLTLPESLNRGNAPKDLRRFSFRGLEHALFRPIVGPLILMFFANGFAFAGMEQTLSLLIQNRLYAGPKQNALTQVQKQPSTTVRSTATDTAIPYDQLTLSNPNNFDGREFEKFQRKVTRDEDARASRAAGFLFFGLGIIVATIQGGLIHRLTKRVGEPVLVISGPALIAVGLFIIGIPPSTREAAWVGLSLGCVILAVGSSIFTPAIQSLISRHASSGEQGEILGANQGMASLARALGPILAGFLFQTVSPGAPYYTAAVICMGVSVAALGMREKLRPPVQE